MMDDYKKIRNYRYGKRPKEYSNGKLRVFNRQEIKNILEEKRKPLSKKKKKTKREKEVMMMATIMKLVSRRVGVKCFIPLSEHLYQKAMKSRLALKNPTYISNVRNSIKRHVEESLNEFENALSLK